jgi:carboxylesterase
METQLEHSCYFREARLKSKPNIYQHPDLNGSTFFWPGTSTGVLLTHGFTATSVEVRQMAKYLASKDFTVAGPLLPGHGKTIQDMNQVHWQDWVAAIDELYCRLANQCEEVFVIGESMGALLSMVMCLKHPEIKGAMLFAPAIKVPKLGISEYIWPFKEFIFKANVDESMEWQGFNVVPLHAASQLVKLQRYVKKNMVKIYVPTLVFQGQLDHSIDPVSSILVLEGISSEEKELIWLEESSHCILIDKQLPEVEQICLDFITRHL